MGSGNLGTDNGYWVFLPRPRVLAGEAYEEKKRDYVHRRGGDIRGIDGKELVGEEAKKIQH